MIIRLNLIHLHMKVRENGRWSDLDCGWPIRSVDDVYLLS